MIRLRLMNEAEYANFARNSLVQYAAEKSKGEGLSAEEGRAVAEKQWAEILPDGQRTKDQYFFQALDENDSVVGHAWLALKKRARGPLAFIYDIEISASQRGKGLGRTLMQALETEASRLGAYAIALHVFGHNTTARALYESLNYRVTNVNMEKELP